MPHPLHAPDGKTPLALVFDLDGTLADTMPAHFLAWTEVTRAAGLAFPEERFYAMGGVPTLTILRTLIEEQGHGGDADELAARKEAAFERHIPAAEPAAGVVAVLRSAQAAGLPCAVATGGNRATAAATLGAIGLAGDFPPGKVVAAEDTDRHKPHPAPYLLAAERLGVAPTGCDAYEDTDLGLESARAAGMRGIDVRRMRHAFA